MGRANSAGYHGTGAYTDSTHATRAVDDLSAGAYTDSTRSGGYCNTGSFRTAIRTDDDISTSAYTEWHRAAFRTVSHADSDNSTRVADGDRTACTASDDHGAGAFRPDSDRAARPDGDCTS